MRPTIARLLIIALAGLGLIVTIVIATRTETAPQGGKPAVTSGRVDTSQDQSIRERVRATTNVSFVKDESCAECHELQYDEWLGSDHKRARSGISAAKAGGHVEECEFGIPEIPQHGRLGRVLPRDA